MDGGELCKDGYAVLCACMSVRTTHTHAHNLAQVLSTATAMKRDIGGLFGKIARKVDVAAANDDVANLYTTELYQQVRNGGFSCSSE